VYEVVRGTVTGSVNQKVQKRELTESGRFDSACTKHEVMRDN
jgi:hypothetical protein